MKQFLSLTFLVFTTGLTAQVEYGTIDYVRQTEMSISSDMVDDKMMKEIHNQMASNGAFTDNFTATFSPVGFTFVETPKEATSIEMDMGGGGIMIMETGSDEPSSFYTDTKNGRIVNRDFIFDKGFLVEGSADQLDWEITDETIAPSEATIGLDLKVATTITPEGDTLTAGFAPSLPVQVGPRNFYGLPGAIITLKVRGKDGGGGLYRATALSVSADPVPLVKPTEGKKISLEKFHAEKKKKEQMMIRKFRQ